MSVNDVITSGGRPAFFLDVITCGRIDPDTIAELVEGIADGCTQARCALLGGETAEHPDMMQPEEIDLAGFCVALSERRELVSGARVKPGDAIIALPSSGPHSNGFSLIRRLLERATVDLDSTPAELGGVSVADALLEPTRIYATPVHELTRTVDVRGMAHITGGGLPGNLTRQFPEGTGATIDLSSWTRPAVFDWLAGLGVEEQEMRSVFNLGVGFAAVVEQESVDTALTALERGGCPGWVAGDGDRLGGGGADLRIGVLISGNGTNLQALIDAGDIEIACVVSSRARCARALSAPSEQRFPCSPPPDETGHRGLPGAARGRAGGARGIHADPHPGLSSTVPAGVINVHPSLLPAFPGRTAIADALAHGVRVTGVTVHRVDAGIDTGPILLQEAVTVPYDDDALDLEDRIHQVEHRLLVQGGVRDYPNCRVTVRLIEDRHAL